MDSTFTERALAEGLVRVERGRDDWYYISIGRAAKVKRFNLRDAEARQLIEQLLALLPG